MLSILLWLVANFSASRPGELVDFRDSSIVRHGPTEEEAKGAQAFSLRDLFQESGCHKRPGNRDGRLRRGTGPPDALPGERGATAILTPRREMRDHVFGALMTAVKSQEFGENLRS